MWEGVWFEGLVWSVRCKTLPPLDTQPVSVSASAIHQPPPPINNVDWWNSERYLCVICVKLTPESESVHQLQAAENQRNLITSFSRP